MTTQISTDTKVSDLLAKVMPDLTKEALAKTNAANEFGGTELSLMVEASQSTYGYILKDGKDVDVVEGAIDNPTVLLKVSEDDIQKMITNQELDMLLSLTTDLTKSKYDCVKGLNGGFNAKLARQRAG